MGKSEYALSDNDRELYRPFTVVRQLSPASATALEFFSPLLHTETETPNITEACCFMCNMYVSRYLHVQMFASEHLDGIIIFLAIKH